MPRAILPMRAVKVRFQRLVLLYHLFGTGRPRYDLSGCRFGFESRGPNVLQAFQPAVRFSQITTHCRLESLQHIPAHHCMKVFKLIEA